MNYLENKLIGLLFWQTHFPSNESEAASKELLTQLERRDLEQVGGGKFEGSTGKFEGSTG